MITVKNIDGSETYVLRQKILRPSQTLADCKYPSDYETDSFHLGAFINDKLISIASFSKEIYPDLPTGIHYRLRGMATLPEFRNNHAGSSLIQKAEQILQERQANILWCNGRITVADYYKRLGFQEHGEIFEIEPIGLHKVLYKEYKKSFPQYGKAFLIFQSSLFIFFIYMYINRLGTKKQANIINPVILISFIEISGVTTIQIAKIPITIHIGMNNSFIK